MVTFYWENLKHRISVNLYGLCIDYYGGVWLITSFDTDPLGKITVTARRVANKEIT